MTPVLWWNYPVWLLSSVFTGALAATYVRDSSLAVPPTQAGKTFAGGVLSLLAVGCPVCNKLVVMAVGVSGALNFFAQPVLAFSSLGRQRTKVTTPHNPGLSPRRARASSALRH